MRKPDFCISKTKTQISFAVTARLISTFVFATRIVQSLYFLNPKFQASSTLLELYSPVCVGPGRKPQRPVFSERGSTNAEQKLLETEFLIANCSQLQQKKLFLMIFTVKFLNFRTPEFFAVIYLKFKQRGRSLRYFVKSIQME